MQLNKHVKTPVKTQRCNFIRNFISNKIIHSYHHSFLAAKELNYQQLGSVFSASDISTQTDLTMDDIGAWSDRINTLTKDIAFLQQQESHEVPELNTTSQMKLRKQEPNVKWDLSEENLRKCPQKLQFYTGIKSAITFFALCNLLYELILKARKLSKFDQIMIFFLKIRLNLFDEDIAYRFDVSISTVSRKFHIVLNAMHAVSSRLIIWPNRDTLRTSMPTTFRKFFKQCAVIIDCSEIFIERPADLLARATVWSNYKHHSTIKFLIGITPQGTVSFVSHAWGGRVSDKVLTENSGLLNLLLPGDVILADRGFTCDEYAGLVMAEIKMPPFTKGKRQLSKMEVDWSRELSAVRIHVERVLGGVKQKYTILSGTLPNSFVKDSQSETDAAVDKLIRSCCALFNLSPPIVSLD